MLALSTVLSPLSSLYIAPHIFSLISNTTCFSTLCSVFSIFVFIALFLLSYHSTNCSISFFLPSLLQFNFVWELWCSGPVRGFLPKYFLQTTALPNFPWLFSQANASPLDVVAFFECSCGNKELMLWTCSYNLTRGQQRSSKAQEKIN